MMMVVLFTLVGLANLVLAFVLGIRDGDWAQATFVLVVAIWMLETARGWDS